jgi:hypothetical protein
MRWYHWTVEEFESYANPGNCHLLLMERIGNGKYIVRSDLKRHPVKHNYQRPIKT